MNSKYSVLLFFLCCVTLFSCSKEDLAVMWVDAYQSPCDAGAGEKLCYRVTKGELLENAEWELFHSEINGFKFEEGFLQKIKVNKETLDPKKVPADGSSIKYSLVEVMEKKKDPKSDLHGDWILATMDQGPINKMVVVPQMTIDMNNRVIGGNAGCNTYTTEISAFKKEMMVMGNIAVTTKACANKNIESEYLDKLKQVTSYSFENNQVFFYDKNGSEILSFIKA